MNTNTMNVNTRRGFVKASLAGAAATLATLPVRSQQAANRPPWTGPTPASLMCYSFFGLHREGKMDVFGFLETCKYRYGLQAGDLWSGFMTSTDESYLKQVRGAYDEREMVCPQLAVDGAHIWEANADVREKNYQNALTYLKANTILGAKFVRLDAGGATQDKQWSDEAFDHIVKRYREYCQFASDHGFKVGPEDHWGPEATFANMKRLFEAVNHPAFGLLLHFSNPAGGFQGTPEQKLAADKEAAKWACHTHIAWEVASTSLLVEKMNLLRDAGYQGYYCVEHHSGRNEYSEVAVQLSNVRRVLDSWRTGGNGIPSAEAQRAARGA